MSPIEPIGSSVNVWCFGEMLRSSDELLSPANIVASTAGRVSGNPLRVAAAAATVVWWHGAYAESTLSLIKALSMACVKRIQDDETGHKHCTGQYFDYWHCVDKCVAPKLFPKLK